ALDPALSGDLLSPGAHVDETGMPDPGWLERALAEQRAARREQSGEGREALHRHLVAAELLALLGLGVVGRRVDPPLVEIRFDRVAPDGRWGRLRAELSPDRRSDAFAVQPDGRVEVDASVRHLLARHVEAPLAVVHDVLADVGQGPVVRLGRSCV